MTEAEHTAGATATEIRTANTKTRSFVKKIQSAMFDGIKATLEADAVFLNIPLDLYTVNVDFFDSFADETEQWNRLLQGRENGVVEDEDLITWLFPTLSEQEKADKIARISEKTKLNTDEALNRILQGQ